VTALVEEAGQSARAKVARLFLAGLASQNFDRLASTLSDEVHFRALLPAGMKEWTGADRVKEAFLRWFGDTEEFELVHAEVVEIGPRLHVWWRARLRAERLGAGPFIAEQHAYVDTDDENRICRLSLVCSGYLADTPPQ
jgi:hypothetical protein